MALNMACQLDFNASDKMKQDKKETERDTERERERERERKEKGTSYMLYPNAFGVIFMNIKLIG